MLSGYFDATGSFPGSGSRPLSTEGTATSVSQYVVVALRYQVESPASSAKFGKRTASMR